MWANSGGRRDAGALGVTDGGGRGRVWGRGSPEAECGCVKPHWSPAPERDTEKLQLRGEGNWARGGQWTVGEGQCARDSVRNNFVSQ